MLEDPFDLDFTGLARPAPPPRPINGEFQIGEGAGAGRRSFTFARRAAAPGSGGPILVLEDDEVTRRIIEKVLTLEGYGVRAAANGREFVALLRSMPAPALLLLDVILPDVNGFELLEKLRRSARGRSLPVVLLTGRSDPQDLLRGSALGADGYLTKPVKVATLRETLRTVLGTGDG